ncbi:MAG TPA: hypothetical protein VMM12_03560 [Longimicrobiales bacterium]|nr:hypothetical protein [Longimicrobiales bacterium]
MAGKRIKVVEESGSGRNERFQDTRTREVLTRPELVRRIASGDYPNYHVREVNGVKTPVSNPDQSEGNNLG